MASFCRSAAVAAVRSASIRSKITLLSPLPPRRASALLTSRSFVAALGTVQSLMPLHSAIASSRLRSSIGFDTSCWSCLSQVHAVPF